MEELSLANNSLQALPEEIFHSNFKLKKLYLHNNQLKALNGNVFMHLVQLEISNLSNNQISTLSYFKRSFISAGGVAIYIPDETACMFENNRKLKYLFLNGNKIVELSCFQKPYYTNSEPEIWNFASNRLKVVQGGNMELFFHTK